MIKKFLETLSHRALYVIVRNNENIFGIIWGQKKSFVASDVKFVQIMNNVTHFQPRLPIFVDLVKKIISEHL